MPIVVGHEPPIATAGRMALTVGQAQAIERARARAEQARQAAAAAEAQRARLEAEKQQRQQALAWDQTKFYDTENFKREGEDLSWRRTLAEKGIDYEMQQKIEVWRQQVKAAGEDAQYTTQQRRDIEAINERLQWLDQQDDWPEEDKHNARQALIGQYLKITPFPAPQRDWPKGQGPGEYWNEADPQTGGMVTFTRTKDGDIKVIHEPKDQTKQVTDLYVDLTKAMTTMDANGAPVLPDPTAVKERVREILTMTREMQAGAGAPAAANQPVGNAPDAHAQRIAVQTRGIFLDQFAQAGTKAGQERADEPRQEQIFRALVERIQSSPAGKVQIQDILEEGWKAFDSARRKAAVPNPALAQQSSDALDQPPEPDKVDLKWWLAATTVDPQAQADNGNLVKLYDLIYKQGKVLNDREVEQVWQKLTFMQKAAVTRALERVGKLAEMTTKLVTETSRPAPAPARAPAARQPAPVPPKPKAPGKGLAEDIPQAVYDLLKKLLG